MYQVQFTLRLDEELHEEIKKLAEKDKRSINSEIIYILEKYLEEKKED